MIKSSRKSLFLAGCIKGLTNGNNVGMISNVTFVNKFVTIVKMFPLTRGTIKTEVIYEHKWQKVVQADRKSVV